MEGESKPALLSTKDKFKAQLKRRWNKKLTKKEERYSYHIEEELSEEAVEEAKEAQPNKCSSCREQGRHILHSKHVLRLIVALCILDCIMVMVELVFDNTAIRHDIVDKYGLRGGGCADQSNQTSSDAHRRKRAAAGGDGESHGAHSPYAVIAHYCHYVSVGILCLLTLETLIKVFCFGKKFFRSKLEVFDAFVVIASLIADLILLDGVTNGPPLQSSAIVNLLLPWRIIRVVNSLIIATRDHEHFKLLLVYKAKKQVEDQLDCTVRDLQSSRNHVKTLMQTCKQAGLKTEDLHVENENGNSKTSLNEKSEKQPIEKSEKPPNVKPDDVTITFHDKKTEEGGTDKEPSDEPVTHL